MSFLRRQESSVKKEEVMADFEVLEELFEVIKERQDADPEKSYAAKLFERGRPKIAQKFGEEAVELVIEAIADNKKDAVAESADVLFHMLMLWADMGIKPEKVMKELEKRKGKSGIEEKKNRKK